MRLQDLLEVLREEFAQTADDIDAGLMAWLTGGAASADVQANVLGQHFDRLADTLRMLALDSLALTLVHLRDTVHTLAVMDEGTMGAGLSWLLTWRGSLQPCIHEPGAREAALNLVDWLRLGPLSLDDAQTDELLSGLVLAPQLPVDDVPPESLLASLDDVSIAVPDDVAPDLFEAFVADAPEQVGRLAAAVRALGRDGLGEAELQEAQRVAHTFKGSGNIIGVRGVGRLAHRIEDLIEFAATQGGRLPVPMARDLEQATATLDQMLYALRGEEAPPGDALPHLQALLDWLAAIREDRWQERVAAHALQPTAPAVDIAALAPLMQPQPVSDGPRAATASPAATTAAPAAEPEGQTRVGAGQLDRLVRRAGQGLVHAGRLDEQLRGLDQRLRGLQDSHLSLQQRLRELQLALEHQGVSLQDRRIEGVDFDPLEMDRYNQLHALSRFVTELVDDARELEQAASRDAAAVAVTLRQHGQALRDQHRDLLAARLVPMRNIVSRLRRTVSQTASTLGRQVRLDVDGDQVQLDANVLERLTEPLLHLMRNAVDHGIEPAEERALYGKADEGCIVLSCRRDGQTVHVDCRDDGRGIDWAAVHQRSMALGLVDPAHEPDVATLSRLILLPGFSTRSDVTEVSGRGIGLDVVAERVRAMKGHLEIRSEPLAGTTFSLRVPATTGALHALIVDAGGERLAVPTEAVLMALAAGQGEVMAEGLRHQGQVYRRVELADLVRLPASDRLPQDRPTVLVRLSGAHVALSVDAVIDARELILQDVGSLLQQVPGVSAGALRADGRVLFVLDLEALDRAGKTVHAGVAGAEAALRRRSRPALRQILVVDDSLSVRKALAHLLQDAGFDVLQARDGFDALHQLDGQRVELVLTDLEMPNLNGLDLTRQLRGRADGARLPVLMITSRASDKHRQVALEAGVSDYLTKPYTDADLLQRVRRLLGV